MSVTDIFVLVLSFLTNKGFFFPKTFIGCLSACLIEWLQFLFLEFFLKSEQNRDFSRLLWFHPAPLGSLRLINLCVCVHCCYYFIIYDYYWLFECTF